MIIIENNCFKTNPRYFLKKRVKLTYNIILNNKVLKLITKNGLLTTITPKKLTLTYKIKLLTVSESFLFIYLQNLILIKD